MGRGEDGKVPTGSGTEGAPGPPGRGDAEVRGVWRGCDMRE